MVGPARGVKSERGDGLAGLDTKVGMNQSPALVPRRGVTRVFGRDSPASSVDPQRHGMNVRVLSDPFSRLLWTSPALPGSTDDLTAERWGLPRLISGLRPGVRTVVTRRGASP